MTQKNGTGVKFVKLRYVCHATRLVATVTATFWQHSVGQSLISKVHFQLMMMMEVVVSLLQGVLKPLLKAV